MNTKKRTYTYDDAFKASVDYFNGDELAARVWVNKYAMKDSSGAIYEKSPEEMHWRIANEIALSRQESGGIISQCPVINIGQRTFVNDTRHSVIAISRKIRL